MKRISLLIATLILTMLTACGAGQDHGESETGAGQETPKSEAGVGYGTTEPVVGTEEPEDGTAADGENAALTERTYEKESVLYSEPRGLAFRKDLEKIQTDYAAYYFEPAISGQERNGCIEATDKMLSCIDAALPAFEILVLEPNPSYGVAVSGNRLFVPPQQWDSVDYLAKVLLAGYGEWGNYGLAYGYTNYLYKKAGLEGGEINAEERDADSFLPMSAPELYDLNLLCFDERFGSAEDVKAAKNNACLFVKEYLSSHSEEEFLELLSGSGTLEGVAQANKALEAFYAENGVECSLTGIRYQYGGLTLDYAAVCEYACFHVARDWQDRFWKWFPLMSENFLHENYGEVRAFFECSERQMGQYQELFGFDSYNNSLLFRIEEHSNEAYGGFYYGRQHIAWLSSVVPLMHEYVHSLMHGHFGDWETKWKVEGVAQYFDYKYSVFAHAFLNELYKSPQALRCQEYIGYVGRPIDAQTDFQDLGDLYMYQERIKYPNFDYDSGASFVGYLVDQYGEQAVIAYVCSDNEYNEDWDKSYDELVQDWNQYIEEKYSQYGKD